MSDLALEHAAEPSTRFAGFTSSDFRDHVDGGWGSVHPAVRERMDRMLDLPSATVFEGEGCVRRNLAGVLFALASKLVGSPLLWRSGERVRTTVTVASADGRFRCWHRHFVFENGQEHRVTTTKMLSAEEGMLDVVGVGGKGRLATRMRIWAEGRSLRFESTGYVWCAFGRKLPIPSLLTPGTLHAEHTDLGEGRFRYILAFRHPLWGETFYQDGVFRVTD